MLLQMIRKRNRVSAPIATFVDKADSPLLLLPAIHLIGSGEFNQRGHLERLKDLTDMI